MTTLATIAKRLERIETSLSVRTLWLTESQVISDYDLSRKYLQNLRREGRVRYRSLNGRKFRYFRTDLENLFQ